MTYVFDIDGTICKKVIDGDYSKAEPYINRIKTVNRLYKEKNTIIFQTARAMGRTNNNYKKAHELGYDFTLNQLKSWKLSFDELVFGKPSFDLIIDDKAFNYSSNWINKI